MTATASSGGKNKKSAAAHKLNGTYRPDRHGGVEATSTPEGVPECPETLTEKAKDEWDRIVGLMTAARTVTASDGPVIKQVVQLIVLADRLQGDVDQLESTSFGKLAAGGQSVEPALHPCVSHVVRVRSSIRLYLSELGLTPASRDRVPKLTALGRDLERQEHDRFFGPR